MFEMWNNVATKLEVQQSQVQSQQPHTSSGSIKGSISIYLLKTNTNTLQEYIGE